MGETVGTYTPLPVRAFLALCEREGLPVPEREHRFHPSRRWRLDYAWPEARVALEVEGGVWTNGRHTRASGFLRDVDKYNALAVAGWRLLRCTPDTLTHPSTLAALRACLRPDAD